MPGRQAHGRLPTKAPKARSSKKNRALNAFAIAAQQHPENVKIRQTRLGKSEGGNQPLKRGREFPNNRGDEEEESSAKRRKKVPKGRFDELDIDQGSDSEGNEWRMGEVDDDDDSDLDSDEAFGESDEEKFEGYAFSGSTEKGRNAKKSKAGRNAVTLDEDEVHGDSESGEESLGEDAIDLAAMLDATDADEEGNENENAGQGYETEETHSNSSATNDESEDESSTSSIYSEDDNDPGKAAALQDLIDNLPQSDRSNDGKKKRRNDGAIESQSPSGFSVTSKAKLTLEDLGLPSVKDPYVKKSLKFLEAETKGTEQSGKLAVPLAKRQQDRLDRGVAYDKSKETLERWTDTVKHNRRADHLSFPLPDVDANSLNANSRLHPTNSSKPFNDLEAAIQNILEESGLGTADGKDDEDKLREFEELETKKMSLEEVKARRDQLRIARDLMFREETRAKRIKKIKSKSYRRVHRKEREKGDRINKQALIDAGIDPSEDEQEALDRRRAMERMGSRHRDSKWAKANKETGRAAWDQDARTGITEMARRDEELRKRVDGQVNRNDSSDDSGSMSELLNDSDVDDESLRGKNLLRKLDDTGLEGTFSKAGPGVKLSNMKFMLKAEEARRKQNDETVAQIRKELVGEDEKDEIDLLEDVGRRTFGPGTNQVAEMQFAKRTGNSEFEELDWSDEETSEQPAEKELSEKLVNMKVPSGVRSAMLNRLPTGKILPGRPAPILSAEPVDSSHETGAWSKIGSKKEKENSSNSRHRKQKLNPVEELDLTNGAIIAKLAKKPKKQQANTSSTILHFTDDENTETDDAVHLPFAIQDQELIKRAFAGADVVGEFEAEKRQIIEDEDEKIVDITLPGWGSWTGDGLSKREKSQNKGRFLTKTEGIKEQNRKDAKLERVIINESRVKKNGKYLASSLPHPFETRQQYERSLRLPVGPEWTTKESFQDATKPRILLKQGIIAPMSKPLL